MSQAVIDSKKKKKKKIVQKLDEEQGDKDR
jgi:hypothetical protein